MTSIASPAQTDPRAAHIQGMRALADLLETHPELPLPFGGNTHTDYLFINGDSAVAHALTVISAMDEPPTAEIRECNTFDELQIRGWIHGYWIMLRLDPRTVCGGDEVAGWRIPAELLAVCAADPETAAVDAS